MNNVVRVTCYRDGGTDCYDVDRLTDDLQVITTIHRELPEDAKALTDSVYAYYWYNEATGREEIVWERGCK